MSIRVKRVYEPPDDEDGFRVLVDRLWPRGLSRSEAGVDLWLKDLAPSDDLRKWFGHSASRWDEFKRRYEKELQAPKSQEGIERIRRQERAGNVTLLFSARDAEHNNAVALLEFLRAKVRGRRVA
jgi:uncharacterized protein YeaO (DUF488 family)